MRIAKIEQGGRVTDVVVLGSEVRVISEWRDGEAEASPFDVATLDLAELRRRLDASGETLAAADIRFLPPIGPRSKLVCLGLNYRDHIDEVLADTPPQPGLFIKYPDALVGHGAVLTLPKVSEAYDYEGEIAIVIGKAGRHIAAERAMEHVFGYTIMMDGSVRDYQKHSVSAGKNFWHSGALGPWVATAEEVSGPAEMELTTRLNGEIVQHSNAGMLIYDIPTIIAYVSRFTPLASGDIIATGTPAGVGAGKKPPVWLRAGDRLEIEVSGVGALANHVEAEAA